MPIPARLRQIIENALAAMRLHPQNDLNLGYRQAIWAELGPRNDTTQATIGLGHRRRAILALFTARHVLPIWERAWPADKKPHSILKEAEQVLKGTLIFNPKEASEHLQNLWTWLENMIVTDDELVSFNVGFSAVKALTTALIDELFDPNDIDYSRTDKAVDSYDADSSFYAAAAYANGSIWESSSAAEKRREFWEWWLTETVPAAWEAVV